MGISAPPPVADEGTYGITDLGASALPQELLLPVLFLPFARRVAGGPCPSDRVSPARIFRVCGQLHSRDRSLRVVSSTLLVIRALHSDMRAAADLLTPNSSAARNHFVLACLRVCCRDDFGHPATVFHSGHFCAIYSSVLQEPDLVLRISRFILLLPHQYSF